MKIRPTGAELFHADRRKYRHDEANGRLSQFREQAQKYSHYPKRCFIFSQDLLP